MSTFIDFIYSRENVYQSRALSVLLKIVGVTARYDKYNASHLTWWVLYFKLHLKLNKVSVTYYNYASELAKLFAAQ